MHRAALDALVDALLGKERVSGDEVSWVHEALGVVFCTWSVCVSWYVLSTEGRRGFGIVVESGADSGQCM